jgi:tetratricopeptide (TPR) repeat protein
MAKSKTRHTPIEIRLNVGVAALQGRPSHGGLEGLASQLARAIGARPPLALAVQRLLIARRPLPPDAVRRISGVDEEYLPLLTSCIGYGRDQVRVPERTRQILMTHLRRATDREPEADEATHAELASYYETLDGERSPSPADPARTIAWLEKVHHLAWGGAATQQTWNDQEHLGREQIWERARYLSYVLHRYEEAAGLYRKCIADFGADSYSLHYEAFNIERARGPKRLVREGYAAAVGMDKANPWWNGRWTTFLIANGTLAEAESAWREALRNIDPTGDWMASSPWLALHLHQWVCRQWLALGYVQQARNVLNEIDPRWLGSEPELSSLRTLVEDHEEAMRLGESVYPSEVPQHERWQKPRVLPARDADRNELRQWWPGRVIEAHPDEVVAVLADRQTRLAQQAIFTGDEWRAFANQPSEDAQGFFELGEYDRGGRIVRWAAAESSSLLDEIYEDLVDDLRS